MALIRLIQHSGAGRNRKPGVFPNRYNPAMKIWIILLSLLAMALVWRWGPHRRAGVAAGWHRRSKQISQSLLAGIVVYFCFMSVAALYLMLTGG